MPLAVALSHVEKQNVTFLIRVPYCTTIFRVWSHSGLISNVLDEGGGGGGEQCFRLQRSKSRVLFALVVIELI